LIIICSSTGDGDPPEDSLRFASKLNDLLGSGQKSLAHINFALLGKYNINTKTKKPLTTNF
jgi:sulfite reductase alpha subunit-like flavoprotein